MADTDTLSSEDIQALVHTQQQLYSAKDPRAEKLYNFIVRAGYATKDAQGGLIPSGSKPNSASGGWTLPGAGRAIVTGLKNLNDKQNQMVRDVASGTSPFHQAFDAASQTEPIDTSSVGSFAKSAANDLGAGATRLFTPIAHPLNTIAGSAKMGQVAFDPLAHQDTIQQAVAPFVKNPSGEAVAAIPQAALMLATAGAKGMPEESTQVPPDVPSPQSRIPNPVTAAKNLMAGPPEAQITKALQPNKNNVNWNADVKTALPQIKATEAQMGKPIEGFEGANAATTQTLKNIWSQVDTYLTRGGKIGATIDGNQIADAMVNSIDKRMATQNPAMAARVKELADTYRRPLSVNEAEDFIQSNNKELTGYYAKNKLSRQQAAADPEINAKIVEGDTLRDALYSKIDELSGPGVAQLKKAYGAVRNLQNNLTTQMQVYARKAPANLGEQLSYFQAAGKAITGHPIEALGDIAVRRFLSDLNDKNSMITRAFGQTQPAQPFPMPSAMPRIAGQLPAQTGGPFELPPANPMTGGERLAALMQMLRQRQQLSLPANVQPRQLPPSF